jgi:hypothetical protein
MQSIEKIARFNPVPAPLQWLTAQAAVSNVEQYRVPCSKEPAQPIKHRLQCHR